MRVRRGRLPADRYTRVSNDWLRDQRLSWKARGILSWLASHNVGFEIDQATIVAASARDGRDAVRGALQELDTYGYLRREQPRGRDGKLGGIVYTLSDPWGGTADGFSATGSDLGEQGVSAGGTADGFSATGSSYKKTREDQEKTREKSAGEPAPPHPLGPPRADTPEAIDAEIIRMLGDITGLAISPAHAATIRTTLLATRPHSAGNHLLYIQTTIRRLADSGRAAELLPSDLAAAYAQRTGRPAHRPAGQPPDASRPPAKQPFPEDFPLTDGMRRWVAATYPAVDVDHETDKFRHHYRARGTELPNWYAAWQKWITQASQFAKHRPRPATELAARSSGRNRPVTSAADRRLATNLDAVAWAAEQDRLEAQQKGQRL